MLKNYVISLANAHERRTHVTQEFGQKGVNFEFFDAITPEQINDLAVKFGLNITNANLTKGELACLFSHVSLWQKAIDENLDYIAIFEDDVYLGENADYFLNDDGWIPEECEVIKLEKFSNYCSTKKTPIIIQERQINIIKEMHLGASGYILSQNICQYLLGYINNSNPIIAVDHILFENILNDNTHKIYQMKPALCIQSDRLHSVQKVFKSTLEDDRRIRINKLIIKPNKSQKIRIEIMRIFKQIRSIIPNIKRKIFDGLEFL